MRLQESNLGFKEFEMVIGQEYARANQRSPPSETHRHRFRRANARRSRIKSALDVRGGESTSLLGKSLGP